MGADPQDSVGEITANSSCECAAWGKGREKWEVVLFLGVAGINNPTLQDSSIRKRGWELWFSYRGLRRGPGGWMGGTLLFEVEEWKERESHDGVRWYDGVSKNESGNCWSHLEDFFLCRIFLCKYILSFGLDYEMRWNINLVCILDLCILWWSVVIYAFCGDLWWLTDRSHLGNRWPALTGPYRRPSHTAGKGLCSSWKARGKQFSSLYIA